MAWKSTLLGAGTAVGVVVAGSVLAALAPAAAHVDHRSGAAADHVLLLSVDGLHQSDLTWYASTHPSSALARLVATGTDYTNAQTTFPSDSFPGMVAQLTGGGPGTSGVYYDDTYNHALLAAGTPTARPHRRGTEVSWTEAADRRRTRSPSTPGSI